MSPSSIFVGYLVMHVNSSYKTVRDSIYLNSHQLGLSPQSHLSSQEFQTALGCTSSNVFLHMSSTTIHVVGKGIPLEAVGSINPIAN